MALQKPKTTEEAMEILRSLEPLTASQNLFTSKFYSDMQVYVLAAFDDPSDEAFYPGKVVEIQEDTVTIKLQDSDKLLPVPQNEVFPLDEEALKGIPDLAKLSNMNEAALLVNLESRFKQSKIYTYVGETLVMVNPYQFKENTPSLLDSYWKGTLSAPHVFSMALDAYNKLWDQRTNQAIVISGESGAGKTESTKQVMRFLSGKSSQGIEERVFMCNPVLEAFGNAKTIRNDNSSRFGKFIKLYFDERTKSVAGASITNYLLEKSRVTKHCSEERNFHVFYLFLKAAPKNLLQELGLSSDLSAYKYLQGEKEVPSISDTEFYEELIKSFEVTGFTQEEVKGIWEVLAVVLSLGNVEFDDSKHEQDQSFPCEVTFDSLVHFENSARILQISSEKLLKAVTFYTRNISGEEIMTPQNKQTCEFFRDSLAKELYSRLFNWIVFKLNKTLNPPLHCTASIGILDIFGFELLEENSFEQFCINYANEKLHQLYISYVFKSEEYELEVEGLSEYIPDLNFVDNQAILDILEGNPRGIFQLIDQACSVRGDSKSLLGSIVRTWNGSQFFDTPKIDNNSFIVVHTARDVDYKVTEFRNKNMDELRKETEMCGTSSGNPRIRSIFTQGASQQASATKFLGANFRRQMNSLMQELNNSYCHFLRCIKPNEHKTPWKLVPRLVLLQVQYLGLLDSIAIRREGFPVKITYKNFYKKFEILHPDPKRKPYALCEEDTDWQDYVEDILEDTLPGVFESHILFGKGKLFLKMEVNTFLEQLRFQNLQKIEDAAKSIQNWWRGLSLNKQWLALRKAVVHLQYLWRKKLRQKELLLKERKVILIQRWFREKLYKEHNEKVDIGYHLFKEAVKLRMIKIWHKKYFKGAVTAQRLWRGYKGRVRAETHKFMLKLFSVRILRPAWDKITFKLKLKASVLIQRVWRGYLCRKKQSKKVKDTLKSIHARREHRAATKIQKVLKGELVRRRLRRVDTAARLIQGFLRARWSYMLLKKKLKGARTIQRAVRSFLVKSKVMKERESTYLTQESALLKNLKLLERSALFCSVHTESQADLFQETIQTISTIAQYSDAFTNHSLTQAGSLAVQTQPVSPFSTRKLLFFNRVLDVDLISDTSLVYDPLWSHQLETRYRELVQHEEHLLSVKVGGSHSAGITNKGKVFTWGWNDKNQCGLQGFNSTQKPRLLETLKEKFIVQVVCGDDHSLALGSDSKVYAFGDNSKGQLGQGHYKETPSVEQVNLPKARQVAAVGSQCMAVTQENELYLWPFETIHGERRSYPMKMLNDNSVSQVSMGYNFAMILCSSGLVYSVGSSNSHGQLGQGDTACYNSPTLISCLKNEKEKITSISCGFKHVVAKSSLGKVFTWGWGSHGQLGHSEYKSEYLPRQVFIKSQRFKALQVSAGWKHSVVMHENRKLYWCGTNATIEKASTLTPTKLQEILPEMFSKKGDFEVLKVECSWSRTMSVTSIIVADTRTVKTSNPKLLNGLTTLASKWTGDSLEPPLVESIGSLYPSTAVRRGPF